MAVASRGAVTSASSLNPNAPLFVPMAYQQVEDFSPEWWSLIKSSAWFRDYWIRERYDAADDFADLLPDDAFDQYESDEFLELESELEGALNASSQKSDEVNEKDKEVATLKSIGMKQKSAFEKHIEKPPQIVNTKLVSPRRIQQPR